MRTQQITHTRDYVKGVDKCKYKEERILKTDKWEYNNDKPYWDTDTEIELYNKPASFTKFNQNSLGKNSS